jgi:hypothetical protein
MLFCYASISAEILPHILGQSFAPVHHILMHFCQMLLPLKALKIKCAKAVLLWHQNIGELTTSVNVIKTFFSLSLALPQNKLKCLTVASLLG